MKAIYFERTAPTFSRMTTMNARGFYFPDQKAILLAQDIGVFRVKDYKLLNDTQSLDEVKAGIEGRSKAASYSNLREYDLNRSIIIDLLSGAGHARQIQEQLNNSIDAIISIEPFLDK